MGCSSSTLTPTPSTPLLETGAWDNSPHPVCLLPETCNIFVSRGHFTGSDEEGLQHKLLLLPAVGLPQSPDAGGAGCAVGTWDRFYWWQWHLVAYH